MINTSPELSVIVPILNEGASLRKLFLNLSKQKEIKLELILSDGGSSDDTDKQVTALKNEFSILTKLICGNRGRGRQMNSGVKVSNAPVLLFIHADSLFDDKLALKKGVDLLKEQIKTSCNDNIAGRFRLRFRDNDERSGLSEKSQGYYYYESKAMLDRSECVNGDQGFMISRSFFDAIGNFNEKHSFLEDKEMAKVVAKHGKWILLQSEISTSARRFFSEGLYERQLLNALIMNFHSIGWDPFFQKISDLYKTQNKTEKLRLFPFFCAIKSLLLNHTFTEKFILWHKTGNYVLSNLWQIAFLIDTQRNFKAGYPPGKGAKPCLNLVDDILKPLTNNPAAGLFTAILTWVWFNCHLNYSKFHEKRMKNRVPCLNQ